MTTGELIEAMVAMELWESPNGSTLPSENTEVTLVVWTKIGRTAKSVSP